MVNPGWLQLQPELRWFHKLWGDICIQLLRATANSQTPVLNSSCNWQLSSVPPLRPCPAGSLRLALSQVRTRERLPAGGRQLQLLTQPSCWCGQPPAPDALRDGQEVLGLQPKGSPRKWPPVPLQAAPILHHTCPQGATGLSPHLHGRGVGQILRMKLHQGHYLSIGAPSCQQGQFSVAIIN